MPYLTFLMHGILETQEIKEHRLNSVSLNVPKILARTIALK